MSIEQKIVHDLLSVKTEWHYKLENNCNQFGGDFLYEMSADQLANQ